jgi:thioredoxin 1
MAKYISELNEDNFDSFIEKGKVIIDFWAEWCGPCKIMDPEFERASKEIKDIKFGKVNVDGNQNLAGRFQVMSIPTTIFFKDNEQIDRHSGAMTFSDIKKTVDDNFG